MNTFDKLKKGAFKKSEEILADFKKRLANIKKNEDILKDYILKGVLTAKQKADLTANKEAKPTEKLIAFLRAKITRQESKRLTNALTYLETIEKAEIGKAYKFEVEWVKNSTWGLNPRVTMFGGRAVTRGSASGCGYDKRSSAISQAMRASDEIMKLIYLAWGDSKELPHGISRDCYGFPCLGGAFGESTYIDIFKKVGFSWKQEYSGKYEEMFTLEKEEQK